jgi:hypothetical protein
MSDTLTIRLSAAEKAEWEQAAADARESVAEYVRRAVQGHAIAVGTAFWLGRRSHRRTRTSDSLRAPEIPATVIHLLDTGPLVSALARREGQYGAWAKDVLRHLPRPLYSCEPVLTEAAHFLGRADPVLAAVADGLIVCPWDLCDHHARVRELLRKYADQPMDLADACLVAMSEQWWECRIVTVDVADFTVYRRRGRHPLPLLSPGETSAPRTST